jgi:hypothetical protein
MRNLNDNKETPLGNSFYNTKKYLSGLISNPKNLSENGRAGFYWLSRQINYDIGVPLDLLGKENFTNFDTLVNICKEHRKSPSQYEKELDDRVSYLIGFNPFKTNSK